MSGLEKILSQISSEAQAAADEAMNKARAQADTTRQEAVAQADAECRSIAAHAEQECRAIEARAESAAALQKRRAVLAAKQEMIGAVIEKAHKTLCGLPTDEYFAAVEKLAAKFALPGEGTVFFNAADLARLPNGFEAKLNQAVGKGRTLTVSAETRPIDGGFVLAYGGVEENCSFAALFSADREALQDKVRQLLFA